METQNNRSKTHTRSTKHQNHSPFLKKKFAKSKSYGYNLLMSRLKFETNKATSP